MLHAAVGLAAQLGDATRHTFALVTLGMALALAGARGDPQRAARLFGAAEARWQASGIVRYAPDQPAYEHDVAGARARLDERAFAAAWAEGRALTARQAIASALEEPRPAADGAARVAGGARSAGLARPA